MIIDISTIISVYNNTLESIFIILYYTFLTDQKKFVQSNKLKSLLCVLTYNVFCLFADALVPSSIKIFLYLIFWVIFIGNITKTPFLQSFTTAAIIFILLILSELIMLSSSMVITQKSYQDLLNTPKFYLIGGLIVKFIQLLLLFFLNKYNIKLLNFKLFKKKKNILSTGLVQILAFSLFCVAFFWKGEYNGQQSIINQALALTLCLLTMIFGIIDYKERQKEMKVSYKLKLQEANFQNMEKLISILRKNHHDIGNHLNTILAISKNRKDDTLDNLEEYVGTLTDSIKSSFKSYNSGNSYINGLLAVKYNEAIEKGIHLEVDFDAKFDLLHISDQVLISIISNIIDNAFDAMENLAHSEHKFISISGYVENNMYNLSICNNGPVISKQNLGKIFDLGFSTKDTISGYNGYGLYIVGQYVKDYNGEITVTSNEDETEFLMRFPLY